MSEFKFASYRACNYPNIASDKSLSIFDTEQRDPTPIAHTIKSTTILVSPRATFQTESVKHNIISIVNTTADFVSKWICAGQEITNQTHDVIVHTCRCTRTNNKPCLCRGRGSKNWKHDVTGKVFLVCKDNHNPRGQDRQTAKEKENQTKSQKIHRRFGDTLCCIARTATGSGPKRLLEPEVDSHFWYLLYVKRATWGGQSQSERKRDSQHKESKCCDTLDGHHAVWRTQA